MDESVENPGPGDEAPPSLPPGAAKAAISLAIAEALASHGHHALAKAHTEAAGTHEEMIEAGLGDLGEHHKLAEWHRWAAVVEGQLAHEADERTPGSRQGDT